MCIKSIWTLSRRTPGICKTTLRNPPRTATFLMNSSSSTNVLRHAACGLGSVQGSSLLVPHLKQNWPLACLTNPSVPDKHEIAALRLVAVTTSHRESLSTDLMQASSAMPPCCHAASEHVVEAPLRDIPTRFELVPTTTPVLAKRLLAQRHEPECRTVPVKRRPQQEHHTVKPGVKRSSVAPEAERCTRCPFRRHVDALLPILPCDGHLFPALSPSEPVANRIVRHKLQHELVDQQEWHWRGHTHTEHRMGSTKKCRPIQRWETGPR